MAKSDKLDVSKKTGKILPPKKDPTDTCNSRTKTGDYCTQKSGWATDHVGTGRCKLHGGASTGRPKKNFSAGEYLNKDIIKQFEGISEEDPTELINLDNEINVVRGHLYEFAEITTKDKKGNPKPIDGNKLATFINSLIKLIDLKAKLEGKIKTNREPTKIVVYYVNQVTLILEKHIHDPELRKRISRDMRNIHLIDEASSN